MSTDTTPIKGNDNIKWIWNDLMLHNLRDKFFSPSVSGIVFQFGVATNGDVFFFDADDLTGFIKFGFPNSALVSVVAGGQTKEEDFDTFLSAKENFSFITIIQISISLYFLFKIIIVLSEYIYI